MKLENTKHKLLLRVSRIALFLFICVASYGQDISTDSVIIHNFNSSHFKVSSYSYSVTTDENGLIYAANESGILEFDGSSWRLIPIRNFSSVISINAQPDGKIYIGGKNEFGYLERDFTGELTYYSLRSQLSDTLSFSEVWQIKKVGGNIYYHSYGNIFKYDGEQVQPLNIKNTWLLPLHDEMLVAVYGKGVAKLVGDSLVIVDESFQHELDAPFKMLPFQGPNKLTITEEHGLYLFDTVAYKMKKWEVPSNKVFEKHGIYDAIVWNDSTYLISSTRGGVYWINKEGEVVRKLTRTEGLQSNRICEFVRDKRGNVWIATEGVTHLIFPTRQDTTSIKTTVRKIETNDSTYYINSNNHEFTLSKYGPISSIVFSFATPLFDKEDLTYSYYLEGFDQDWSNWNDNIRKEYTNLSGGEYTFHVKAKLNDGPESEAANIKVIIPILWYKSPAGYVLGVFIVLLFVWGAASYRAAKLKLHNTQLEQVVQERTNELVEQKEELIIANTELDNFVYRSSHDLIAPLKSLKGLINIAREEKSEEYRVEYFDLMEKSIIKLEDFITSILEYSSNAKGEAVKELVDVNILIDTIIEDLQYFDQAEKVTLHREIDSSISFHSDFKRLKIIMSNLIANAVKYHNYMQISPHIYVRLYKAEDQIILEIADNGQGIEEKYLSTIFDMFVRASDNSEGSGLGLYIVKDTVEKLGGKIAVTSEYGLGTKFTMTFPIK